MRILGTKGVTMWYKVNPEINLTLKTQGMSIYRVLLLILVGRKVYNY